MVAMIHFHNAVHGQPMVILYESDLLLVFRRGANGIVAINKSGSNQWANFSTWGLKNPAKYRDLIHHYEMNLSGNTLSLFVPPRTAQMWLAE
jgi:alpha-amylase